MQADYILDYGTRAPGQAGKLFLMARLTSGPAPQNVQRRPLNLSLVIDRSGSMAGQKLDYTRQAAQFLVENLSANDMFSAVLYNDKVETLLMPENVTRKDAINQRIAGIKAGGTTNLSSGWLEGCKLVDRNRKSRFVNRVILISDGLANRGVTDSAQLVQMAYQKLGEGITTTTMGLGRDFNEDLLMEMANAGGGAYYFIESPEVTPTIFREELQGLLNVLGQNLTIGIKPEPGVKVNNQLNAYPISSDGAYTAFRLGDIFAEELKALVLEIDVPGLAGPGQQQIATLRFEYDAIQGDETEHKIQEIPVMLDVETSIPQLPHPEVKNTVLLLQAANARKRAIRAADQGDYHTAAIVLRQAAESIADNDAQQNNRLLEERNALMQQAADVEQGEVRYDVYRRKTLSTQAFYTMTSRHDDTITLRSRELQKKNQTQEFVPPLPEPPLQVEKRSGTTPTHVTWHEKTFPLEKTVTRVGRSSHNEIVLAVKGVSRFHCQIRRDGDAVYIEDLGSTNGTMIGGKTIEAPYQLSVGDVAYVCDEKLVFHDAPGHTVNYTLVE